MKQPTNSAYHNAKAMIAHIVTTRPCLEHAMKLAADLLKQRLQQLQVKLLIPTAVQQYVDWSDLQQTA